MSIQQSINQAISVAGVLYTQTAGYKLKQQEKINETEVKKIDTNMEKLDEAYGSISPDPEKHVGRPSAKELQTKAVNKSLRLEIGNQRLDFMKQRAMLTGSESDWDKYVAGYQQVKGAEWEDAVEQAKQEKRAKNMPKSNFGNMETSLGGKVSDLDPTLQAKIKEQYEKENK